MTSKWEDQPVEIEVGDVLDLHSFPPSEIGTLVEDYLELAVERGLVRVRIIHGKGIGVQRGRVHRILERHPLVLEHGTARDASGWGATWAVLRQDLND